MKRFFVISLLCSASLQALPIYNPAAASLLPQGVWVEAPVEYCCWWDMFSINFGYMGYKMRDHEMKCTGAKSDDVRRYTRGTNAGYIALNACNRVEVYSTLGASLGDITIPNAALNVADPGGFGFTFETDFSWSIGARATLFECGCLAFGLEGEYFRWNPNIRTIETDHPNGLSYLYTEWQLGFGAAYRISIASGATALIPYLAVRYGHSHFNSGHGQFTTSGDQLLIFPNMKQRHTWGYAVGITLLGCDKIQVTAEGSFINETAALFTASMRF